MSSDRVRMIVTGQRLPGLDAVRFYASSAIILFHLAPLSGIELPPQLAFIATYFGFAVPLFFVASALSLMINYHDRLRDTESIKTFYAKRFFRIAPLFYVMIAFYALVMPMFTGRVVRPDEAIASLLFLFNLLPAYVEGFVWASWSIGVEMAYYLLFPVLLVFAASAQGAIVLFFVAVTANFLWFSSFEAASEFVSFRNFFFLPYLTYFTAGMIGFHVAATVFDRRAELGTWILAVSLTALALLSHCDTAIAALIFAYSGAVFTQSSMQVFWALVLTAISLGLALDTKRLLAPPVVCRLGEISFSTYLWHPVVIYFLSLLGCYDALTRFVGEPFAIFVLSAGLTIAVTIAVALFSYRFIELPGMKIRRIILGDDSILEWRHRRNSGYSGYKE